MHDEKDPTDFDLDEPDEASWDEWEAGQERERVAYEETHDMHATHDARALSDRLHAMLWDSPERSCAGNHSPRFTRLTIDVPSEWLMLASWIDMREELRSRSLDATFQERIGEELSESQMQRAKQQLWWQMNHWFHDELHWLATGAHPLLAKRKPPTTATALEGSDLDDDIPF